ncbi:EamA family transporter RarD [uncultured Roseobacter sp.]|uniref:EamA family transporter RarD n=1 Tax=uncultured Roseobacter sp. TaxID=114847 RepID=UPI002621B2F2|nr:EamA family transporter RarD [uncultured Roseobacter sp.]
MVSETVRGVAAIGGAAVIWGLSPIFYNALAHVPPLDVLAHRLLWSLVLFGSVLALQRRLPLVWQAVSTGRTFGLMLLAAVLVALNWAIFIWAVQTGQTTQSSLGYYIYPLVAVVLGRVFFAERLSAVQWVAVALVTAAVLLLVAGLGTVPVTALALAVSFSFYGLVKKYISAGPVVSVTAEVMLVSPLALALMWHSWHSGDAVFGGDPASAVLLVLAGPVTAVPLILFSYGARRLAMSTVGLLLYLNPTMQFSVAVFLFGELFTGWHLAAFALIWTALALYSASGFRQERASRKATQAEAVSGTAV